LPEWLFPVLGYSFALFLMFVAIMHWEPTMNNTPHTEAVLLTSIPQGAQWTYAQEMPEINKLLDTREEK
jgi:hypothetical protein